MKRFLSAILIGLMSVSVIGCEASAEVDDDTGDSSYKKTTTYDRDDGKTVKTETKTEKRD